MDAIPETVKGDIVKFFLREDISRQLPQKRFVTKAGPGHLMQMTVAAAYTLFIKENKGIKVGLTSFKKARPKNVKIMSTHKSNHVNCLCVYCTNVSFKLSSLNRYASKDKRVQGERGLVEVILCQKSESARFNRPECIQGTCENCFNYKKTLQENYAELLVKEDKLTWNHWERVKLNNDKVRRQLLAKEGTLKELVTELVEDVTNPVQGSSFVQHQFAADWQYRQFNLLKENLPADWILMVMDFARNRELYQQDEIKSAYFGRKQITIHPVVAYYNSPIARNITTRDSMIFLSDDINHDYNFVKHVLDLVIKKLSEKMNIAKLVIFSDGCSSQYKSKGPLADITFYDIQNDRNYFGSEHGKGDSDGEAGVLNRSLDQVVIGRKKVFNGAQDIYDYCQENLTLNEIGSKRSYYLVGTGAVTRNRLETKVNPLAGIRKLHQVMNCPGTPYKLKVHQFSCYCNACRKGAPQCGNLSYVGAFSDTQLKLQPQFQLGK